MPVSADAFKVNAICGLRNGAEAVGGRLLYANLVELMHQYSLTGVTCMHSFGCYRGDFLRHKDSEIGSNELALSLLFSGDFSDMWSFIRNTTGLLRGRGVMIVHKGDELKDVFSAQESVDGVPWTYSELYPDFSEGLKVEVYVMESRQSDGLPVYQRIVEAMRSKGAVWVSVTRAVEGFGMARSSKKTGWFWKRNEVPLIVTAVGNRSVVNEALQEVRRISQFDGHMTVQPVSWYAP
ncbi:DUF190 domain-containing protein [Alicyclobacillus sp. SO9]|uniref:DUF190 domain-containing protein n=1 Tax=Alicyclobacillus sp. SO9 TaxID=2665646 RepID=UPI0018E75642|nr:DUF190 domain-containing protein [Alicyclobacillus sp. SO9]QQE78622.1 DUF190 domain-containing protein [Alicyclobacillus sp. SO9]